MAKLSEQCIESVIPFFRKTKYDSEAKRSFEILSGAFYWSDEMPVCTDKNRGAILFVHKNLIAYRASVILGNPNDECKFSWDYLQERCPVWPGFRIERCSPELKEELQTHINESVHDMERFFTVCERAGKIQREREKG